MAFLDIKAAYDYVSRSRLWTKLATHFSVPEIHIKILQSLFDQNNSRLVVDGAESKKNRKREVFCKDPRSPILFNVYIDDLIVELGKFISCLLMAYM